MRGCLGGPLVQACPQGPLPASRHSGAVIGAGSIRSHAEAAAAASARLLRPVVIVALCGIQGASLAVAGFQVLRIQKRGDAQTGLAL